MSAEPEYRRLVELLQVGGVAVLSGAGLSTESGIPDYRGPDGLRRVSPMTIAEFRASPANRHRYWARSYVGWPRFRAAQPNAGHRAVAALQKVGALREVITQNVDGLHQRAGAEQVIELHGNLARIRCLHCREPMTREQLDQQLAEVNPGFRRGGTGTIQPDGDVVVPEHQVAAFHGPRCPVCGSDMLKPEVVFFGDSVPRPIVERCNQIVDEARALLVLGSSLQVMSGLRFVRRAHAAGLPVAIVTRGPTRGDDRATIRLDAELGPTLTALASDLGVPLSGAPADPGQ